MRSFSFLHEPPRRASPVSFRELPMKGKLKLAVLLLSTVPLLLAGAGVIVHEYSQGRRQAAAELAARAEAVAVLAAPAVARRDVARITEMLGTLAAHPDVLDVRVLDLNGAAVGAVSSGVAESGSALAEPAASAGEIFEGGQLFVSRPVVVGSDTIGTLIVRRDLSALRAEWWRFALVIAALTLLAVAAVAGAIGWLQRNMARPLAGFAALARRVAQERDFSVRAQKSGDTDFDGVVDGFNEMLNQLQIRDQALQNAREELEQRVDERTRALQREQARFKAIFDAVPVGFTWMVSGDVSTRIVNPAHEQITGVAASRRHELGSYREVTHPEDRPAQDALHARLVAGEIDHYEIEKRYVHSNGTVRWAALTVRLYRDPQTGEQQEINTVIDITERRNAQAGLAEASKLLDAMLENTPDFIYFKDRQSRFVRFSNAFIARFKLDDQNTLIGKTDFDLFSREHAEAAFRDEQEIIRTGKAIVGQVEKETYEDGRVTWAMTTKMPWRDSTGKIIGTFGISKDVTGLKEAEASAALERDLLQMLLDTTLDTIYFKDLQSRFVRVSRAKLQECAGILRARGEDQRQGLPTNLDDLREIWRWMVGKTDFDLFEPARARQAFEEEQEVIRSGQPVVNRIEQVTLPDGSSVWHLITKMPWRDKDGNVIGTFGTTHNITAMKEAEAKLADTHRQLLETSRQAGMAEVATGVLHNVGNVLNSVNVSATLVADQVRHTKAANIAKLAALFAQNRDRLPEFISKDPRGQMVPEYLGSLAETLTKEQQAITSELENLRKNIEHIKDIVAMQQAYARTSGVIETVSVPDMIEDAIRMNAGSLARHDVMTIRDYQARGVITTDKHKVIQILINLVRNAKYACDESGRTDKQIIVRTTSDERGVKIAIIDNGVGIPPANLTRIFEHGFTTRRHGHGFGLHSGALAAKELGGSLSAHSAGPGTGATFTLELPYKTESQGQ